MDIVFVCTISVGTVRTFSCVCLSCDHYELW